MDHLVSDIQKAEGLRLTAYKDTKGFWTIGYGHYLNQAQDWLGYTIHETLADWYLNNDLEEAKHLTSTLPEWQFLDTECRDNAIIELVFNMGKEKWEGFIHTRQAIEKKDWQTAHDQLLASDWAKEVGEARSTRLATYLLKGEYP